MQAQRREAAWEASAMSLMNPKKKSYKHKKMINTPNEDEIWGCRFTTCAINI